MRRVQAVEYKTAEEIDAEAQRRRTDALKMQPGLARQSSLKEAQMLQQYAMMKRYLAPKATSKPKGTSAAARR